MASPTGEPVSAAVEAAPVQAATDAAGGAGNVVKLPKTPAAETSIRVSVEKVDQLINLVGELVITQSMLAQTAQMAALDDGKLDQEHLHERLLQLERNTRELQESVMSIRMLPVSSVFNRFPRLVRDLAGKLGKQIELRTQGEATELDKGLVEKITD
ncbi:MAG: chemotaxis protein CheA, partial [Perlucidibaca sp.]